MHPLPIEEHLALADLAEARGYHTAWVPEVGGPDALTTMAALATRSRRLRIASGVVPVQTRTPQVLAMTAAGLGQLAPGRIVLGLGVSSRIIIGQWHGLEFSNPVPRLREAVRLIRLALSGDKVDFKGKYYRASNFRLWITPPEPVKIYLGVVGPRMLELAGELADGVLLTWMTPEALPEAWARIEAGARRAGRSLADFELAAYIRTSVTDDPEVARRWLARDLVQYCIVDSYARLFAATGFAAEMAAVNAAWRAGDRTGAVRQISPRFLHAMGVIGEAAACRERHAEFAKAGVTETVVFPFSGDPDPRPTLRRTVGAFGRDPLQAAP
jgi:probable F420-dependent oxidoreductase